MDDRMAIVRRDLHGRVLGAGRRAADQQRHAEVQSLHLASHVTHLVQAGRDQARQSDDVDLRGASLL
jgi:hypothetical protein